MHCSCIEFCLVLSGISIGAVTSVLHVVWSVEIYFLVIHHSLSFKVACFVGGVVLTSFLFFSHLGIIDVTSI